MAESDTTKDLKKEPPCEGKIKGLCVFFFSSVIFYV